MIKSKKRKKTRQGDGIVNLGISEERRDVSLAGGGGGGACGLVGGGGCGLALVYVGKFRCFWRAGVWPPNKGLPWKLPTDLDVLNYYRQ